MTRDEQIEGLISYLKARVECRDWEQVCEAAIALLELETRLTSDKRIQG